jgi:hypothetical protein
MPRTNEEIARFVAYIVLPWLSGVGIAGLIAYALRR